VQSAFAVSAVRAAAQGGSAPTQPPGSPPRAARGRSPLSDTTYNKSFL